MRAIPTQVSLSDAMGPLTRVLLLGGGALNGFAVRMVEAWASGGFTGTLLGVTLFEMMTLVVGLWLIAANSNEAHRDAPLGLPEIAAGVLLLIPSSAVSWAVVALYGGYLAQHLSGRGRTGALLIVALAVTSLWSSAALKLVALPVTTFEAAAVAQLLALLKAGVVQSANVVGVPSEHSLIVMSACSTADGLPRALVGLAAAIIVAGGNPARQWPLAALLLAIVYIVLNLARLTLMAMSWDFYAIGHGPIGAGVFDALTTAAMIGIVLATERR